MALALNATSIYAYKSQKIIGAEMRALIRNQPDNNKGEIFLNMKQIPDCR